MYTFVQATVKTCASIEYIQIESVSQSLLFLEQVWTWRMRSVATKQP